MGLGAGKQAFNRGTNPFDRAATLLPAAAEDGFNLSHQLHSGQTFYPNWKK
jgi:hypothetical protein